MKLLFITPQLPYPPRQGTTIRNYNLIQYLAKDHTVDLLSFVAPGESLEAAEPLYKLCRKVGTVAQPERSTRRRIIDTFLSALPDMGHRLESAEMHDLITQWANDAAPGEWDIIQIEGIEVAQYGLKLIKLLHRKQPGSNSSLPKLVFDNHNCEYLLQKRNALNDLRIVQRLPAAIYSVLQWQKLERYERRICHASDATLAVSAADQAALKALAPGARVTVIFNGFDLPSGSSELSRASAYERRPSPKILFIGKMDYRPNVDAMLWFGQQIFPIVCGARKDVELQIVGANPHPRLDTLRDISGIEFTGMVEEIEPYLQDAALYVIPLRVGGGTRFKALEAMAYAKPIVTTALGIEGIPVRDGEELLIADTPSEFAQAILTILSDLDEDGDLAQSLGQKAHDLVRKQFTWASIIPKLAGVYEELLSSAEAIEDSGERSVK